MSTKTEIDSDLDTSWIQETERIQNLTENPQKEFSSLISICCLFVNLHNVIDSVVYDQIMCEDLSRNCITKKQLLDISQKHKKNTSSSKFVMKDALLFHIDIDPENIMSFSQCDSEKLSIMNKKFLHRHHTVDDIVIPSSLFIFHDIQRLYFVFQEEETQETKQTQLKSILKKPYSERHKFTKRVKIKLPRNTRKQRE